MNSKPWNLWLKLGGIGLVLLTSTSGCFMKRDLTPSLQAACIRPTQSQGNSLALLSAMATGEWNGGPWPEHKPGLEGANEWVAGVWGRCWPEDFPDG